MSSFRPPRPPTLFLVLLSLLVPLTFVGCASGTEGSEGTAMEPMEPVTQAPEPLEDAELLGLGPKEGEYGLWVRYDGDSIRASWITQEAGDGHFQAVVSGSNTELEVRTSSSGIAHTAALEIPAYDAVLFRYGSAADPADRHETLIHLTGIRRPPVAVEAPDSIFVVGDIHGEYANMVQVFRNAGLINENLEWSGGRKHLVVAGDMVSRGDHATAVLWFLYRLEREAAAAGGRVHILLGNHEFMVVMNDLRYVQPKERRIAEVHGVPYHGMFHPLHSVLGYWLMTKPVAISLDGIVFAHGGLSEKYTQYGLQALDDSVAAWTQEETFRRWTDDRFWEDPNLEIPVDSVGWQRRLDFFFEFTSPIWYRGYALEDEEGRLDHAEDELAAMLDHFGVHTHVVGHTPVQAIHERYGGRLILTNTFPFAAEVLLLVRDPDGRDGFSRWRIGFEGPPMPLQTLF